MLLVSAVLKNSDPVQEFLINRENNYCSNNARTYTMLCRVTALRRCNLTTQLALRTLLRLEIRTTEPTERALSVSECAKWPRPRRRKGAGAGQIGEYAIRQRCKLAVAPSTSPYLYDYRQAHTPEIYTEELRFETSSTRRDPRASE